MSAKEVRNDVLGDVVIAMMANEEFPFENMYDLANTAMEYFVSEGFGDILIELGYKWRPDAMYIVRHLCDVRNHLRKKKGLFLEYKREKIDGSFRGEWAFVRKGEFDAVMKREQAGLRTRTETYNVRLDEARKKWKLESPSVRLALIEHTESVI